MRALTGFVLAGGKSRRMGVDKALLPWKDATLLDHMAGLLGRVADTVRVVGRGDLPDRRPDRGPVEGIATALSATTTRDNLIVAVDLPHIREAFLELLADRSGRSGSGLVVCKLAGRVPLTIGVRRELLAAVDHYLDSGGRSLGGLLASIAHEELEAGLLAREGFGADMFRNINSPDDYRQTRPRQA